MAISAGPRPCILGITGGIGTGKTTLSRYLAESQRWPLLEADRFGHDAMRSNTDLRQRLLERFGPGILGGDGAVVREEVARRVFRDAGALEDLNAMVHPLLLERLLSEVAALRDGGYTDIILLDAALLLEWLTRIHVDWIVVVVAPLAARLERLQARGLSREEALLRIESQRGEAEFRTRARWVLENGGSMEELRAGALALADAVRQVRADEGERNRRDE